MIKCSVVNVDWKKSTPGYLVQGYKDGKVPYDAICGSNGSFIVMGEKARIHLELRDSDGNEYRSLNIINPIRNIMGWPKITAKRVDMLRDLFKDTTVEIDERGYVCNLKDILQG